MYIFEKKNLAIILGNALEYYDFMLYGFFATILAPLFFPSENPVLSLIASMGSYGAGFLARPLGGIFFGHLGDRFGRKDALSLAILLATIPTLCIALLPTYEQIGILAPLLLVLSRLFQGFCVGGEASGVTTYLIENAPSHEKDKASSWIVISCYFGILLGTTLGAIFTSSFMPSWGWRLTFLMGSLIALVGYYIRKKLKESPEFLEIKKEKKILKAPILKLFQNDKLNLMFAACVSCGVVIPFFIIFVYLNGLFTQKLHLEPYKVLILNAGLMVFWIILLPQCGSLARRYGRHIIMSASLLGLGLVAYPLFCIISASPTLESILFTQIVLSLFAMAYAALSSAFLVELFPVTERYSGIAFGYSLGHAIFGGLTPIILTTLAHSYEFHYAPVAFLIFSCVLGLIPLQSASFLKFTKLILRHESNSKHI